jgi:hypothetical protein
MATTTTQIHTAHRVKQLFDEPETVEPLMLHVGAPTELPRDIPTRAMAGAMLAWMTGVFGLVYVAVPLVLSAAGLHAGMIRGLLFNLPSFVGATVVATAAACIFKPRIATAMSGPRDPVIAAASGSLLVWGLLHNLSPILTPFSAFATPQLIAFIGLNVLEMGLIGMLLSSFTRNPLKAFALGAGFQLLIYAMLLGL